MDVGIDLGLFLHVYEGFDKAINAERQQSHEEICLGNNTGYRLVPNMHDQAMAVCIVTMELAELRVLNAVLACTAAACDVLFPKQPQGDSRLQKLLVNIAIASMFLKERQT